MRNKTARDRVTMSFRQFILAKSKKRLWIGILLALVLIGMLTRVGREWWNWAEPFSAVLVLGVAFAVWYQQMREEWEENYLPKRLTVSFYHREREVLRCEKAQLAAEGDIRALAQQIGAQMVNERFLDFVAPACEQHIDGQTVPSPAPPTLSPLV